MNFNKFNHKEYTIVLPLHYLGLIALLGLNLLFGFNY